MIINNDDYWKESYNIVNDFCNYKVGMYIRLSKEDGDKQESESITNQRTLILRYINENKLNLYDEYIDDGVSRNYFWQTRF